LLEEGGGPACSPAPELASPGPHKLIFQWHITERCNLRCTHCYQESYGGDELNFEQWLEVVAQLEALLDDWAATSLTPPRAHINVTGGEPFVHRDFVRLLEVFASKRERLSFAILCNGSFINAAMARKLAELAPGFVQVSIEGLRATHDRIRGKGSFDRTVAAIRHLTRAKVPVLISFTAHRGNFREFPEVARLACDLRVKRVWSDRLIPSGQASRPEMQTLTPVEVREFLELMRAARDEASRRWFCRTEVAQRRALQFLTGHDTPYHCTAGDSLLTLRPNGDLLPCRRLPIRVGNVLETPLRELYRSNPVLRALRDPHPKIKGCEPCSFRHTCRGGLRCLAFAVTGDPFRSDPGCWLAHPVGKPGPSVEVEAT
jgi:radical SAM protein with 4Fe4S-binding SPASM domain